MVELGNTDNFSTRASMVKIWGAYFCECCTYFIFKIIKKSTSVVNVIVFINHIIYFHFIFCIHAIFKVEAQL